MGAVDDKHARLSASQTNWWWHCPGALAYVEAHAPDEAGSGYHAQMGTAAHALVERCLEEGSEPSDYEGRLIEIEDPNGREDAVILPKGAKWPKEATRVVFEVDQEMYEAVQAMTDYVRRRCIELGLVPDWAVEAGGTAIAVAGLVRRGTVRLESRVNPLPDRDDTGGTADVTIDAWPTVLEVVDYKNGSGVFVPVAGNKQLRSYTAGALREVADPEDYELVRYTICQPRHIDSPPDGVMYEEATPAELIAWTDELARRAERVDHARNRVAVGLTLDGLFEDGFLDVGETGSHCTFCDVKTYRADDGTTRSCPAAFAKAQELASIDFDDEPEEIEADAGPNRLAVLLPWVPFLDKWIKALEADAERCLLSGGRIEGQKLVRKRSSGRKWRGTIEVDGEEVELTEDMIVEALVERGAKLEDCYTKPELRSGPQTEKLIPAKQRKAFSDAYMFAPEGGLTVAPESDKRPAVEVDPASDFDGVED